MPSPCMVLLSIPGRRHEHRGYHVEVGGQLLNLRPRQAALAGQDFGNGRFGNAGAACRLRLGPALPLT
jgi:hypothetical protein